MRLAACAAALRLCVCLALVAVSARPAAAADVVLYAADIPTIVGNWARVGTGDGAGGMALASADMGWSQADVPLPSPSHYVEATFTADGNVPYHVWLRLRATANSKFNESVWIQFSQALDPSGSPVFGIGSSSALLVNLENCSGCGVAGWGWQDKAYWLQQTSVVRFASSGTQRIRIQTREDGVVIDQIVLSSTTYLASAPGAVTNDTTVVQKSGMAGGSNRPSTASVLSPYGGTHTTLPGIVSAERFDIGGEGVAYHDTTPGNSGGAVRGEDVDLERSSSGAYDVGWTAAGEWINYSVDVGASGSYIALLHVASPGGGSLHLGFNGPSSVWQQIAVPATGGWQAWTTVSVPITLGGGAQVMTVLFDTGGLNLEKVVVMTPDRPGGTSARIPGVIEAENFDTGPDGVSYHDSTPGNTGGAYRATGVDIEAASGGGYNIGWIAPGEWLNYTADVVATGSYDALIRVASPYGGTMHVGFNGASPVWTAVGIPVTGGWQQWVTLRVPVTLAAGVQQLTVVFDTGGFNLDSIAVIPTSGGPPATGTVVPVITWNIRINDSSEAHARLAMDLLVQTAPRPEIIVIQEGYAYHVNTYVDELQKQTGRTWHAVFATHCAPGNWNGSSCNTPWHEGVGIFTSFPVVDWSSTLMPYADCWTSARAAVRAAVNVNGTVVQVLGTHLQSNSCGDMSPQRRSSMAHLKQWASQLSKPQLMAGDFNGDPPEVNSASGVLPNFIDTWAVGTGAALTAYLPTPTRKIDYWFTDDSGRATPQASQVILSTGAESDHRPVQAVVLIR